MIERGTVTATHDGTVDVAMTPSEACAGCGACASGAGGARVLTGVVDRMGAHLGDVVEVSTPARARRRAQGLVYLLPVASLMVGYLAGFLLSDLLGVAPDTAGAALGLLAGAGAFAATRYAEHNTAGVDRYMPQVHAIISRGQTAGARSTDRSGLTPPIKEDTTRE